MRDQNTPLLPWPSVLIISALVFTIAAVPLGMFYLDPSDNFTTPFISNADNIIANNYSLALCGFLLWLPISLLLLVVRLNPYQYLPKLKEERHLGNWRWTLHQVTFFAIITLLLGGLLLCISGPLLQPTIIEARGYNLCWRVKTGYRSNLQGYARSGLACPNKPSRLYSGNPLG